MNTVHSDSTAPAETNDIVATQVPEGYRLAFLPRHFGRHFMQVESSIFGHMRNLCPDYTGGYWEFFDLSNGGCYVSVWARHLELTGPAPDHRVHEERGGDDRQGSDDATRALAVRGRPGRLHRPAQGRVVHAARLRELVGLSRRAATDAAAAPQSGCSTAWAAA